MRKRIVLLTMILLLGCTGCSAADIAQAANTAEKNVSSDDTDSQSEAEEPELDVEFTKMAEISLAGDSVTVEGDGAEVLDGTIIRISRGGEYVISGSLENGMIYVDTEDAVELTLNGVSITNESGPAILGQNSDAIYINAVAGTENTFTDGSAYETGDDGEAIGKGTVFSNDDLYFIGEGTITVYGNYKHAVKSDDSLFVEAGTLILTAVKDGLNANDTLQINGGTITILQSEEGIEGDILIVNGGDITVAANDDGLNSATDMQINGGSIYVAAANGDALDSNGTMEINGGLIVAQGAGAPEGALDCDDRDIVITGGTVIGTGGTNSSVSETESTQYTVLIGAASAGEAVGILDEDGNTVFAFVSDSAYANLVVSIAGIEEGKTYTVYTGGTITGTESYHGYYAQGVYEGGTAGETFTADSMVISAGGTVDTMGRGGMGGGRNGAMQQGGFPEDDTMQKGDFSEDGTMQKGDFSEDGTMQKGRFSEDGVMPEGELPENGDLPEGGFPENGMMPEGNLPDDGAAPEGTESGTTL